MSASQLTMTNDALLLTGNNTFNAPQDGSPEWNVCSAAYDKGLRRLLDEHNWKFAKVIETVDERTDPDDPAWSDAYAKPEGCIHVVRVMDTDGNLLTDWKILGTKILVNDDAGIMVEFIEDIDPNEWPGLFVDSMMHFLFAGIYRGINKDAASGRMEEKKAEDLLKIARPRGDSEERGKARFVSGMAAARRTRRG